MDRLSRIDMVLKLIEKEPNDVFLNYALGLEYFAEQDLDQAELQFKKVLENQTGHLASYYQLGKLFETKGNVEQALVFYKHGLINAREQKNIKSAGEFEEAIFNLED